MQALILKIKALYARLFGDGSQLATSAKLTVDGVMSAFHKIVAELEEVIDHHNDKVDTLQADMVNAQLQHEIYIAETTSDRDEARNEAARAAAAANKVRALLTA